MSGQPPREGRDPPRSGQHFNMRGSKFGNQTVISARSVVQVKGQVPLRCGRDTTDGPQSTSRPHDAYHAPGSTDSEAPSASFDLQNSTFEHQTVVSAGTVTQVDNSGDGRAANNPGTGEAANDASSGSRSDAAATDAVETLRTSQTGVASGDKRSRTSQEPAAGSDSTPVPEKRRRRGSEQGPPTRSLADGASSGDPGHDGDRLSASGDQQEGSEKIQPAATDPDTTGSP